MNITSVESVNKSHHMVGFILLKKLAFCQNRVYNTPDFAGGRRINPINPTRPRCFYKALAMANFD